MELYKISSPARAPRGDVDTHGLSPLLPARLRRTPMITTRGDVVEGGGGGRNLNTKDSVGRLVDFSSSTGEYNSVGGGDVVLSQGGGGASASGSGGGSTSQTGAARSLMIEHPTTFVRCV